MADLKMPDLNFVVIAGNLTNDPSFRRTSNGTPVANFYIASNRKFKDNNAQWRESVCYVGVVAWYKLAESCAENLRKGSAVLIEGELQSRNWRNEDGTSRNVVEIKAHRIQFLNKRALPSAEEMRAEALEEPEYAATFTNTQATTGRGPEESQPTLPPTPKEEEPLGDTEFDFGYKGLKL